MDTVYYDATSCNYYWGIHGLGALSVWEDVRIYEKNGEEYEMIGFPCICSKKYFSSSLEELKEEYSSEDEWILKVESFLSKDDVVYHYYYDDPEDEDFREVPYEAERNENNVKPRSMEIWYPSDEIDRAVVEDSIRQFCKNFLNKGNIRVFEKDEVSYEDAVKSLAEHEIDMANFSGVSVSKEVIGELSEKTGKSIEEVEKLIEMSLR